MLPHMPTMPTQRNRHRLYITLKIRLGRPGCHWALLLAPKVESTDLDVADCYLFHVTNNPLPDAEHTSGKVEWHYESKLVNPMRSGRLVGKVLIAKLNPEETMETQAAHIDEIVRGLPIVQSDTDWTCHIWVEGALEALRNKGGEFSSVPPVTHRGHLETKIKSFGDKVQDEYVHSKEHTTRDNDLPLLDLRI